MIRPPRSRRRYRGKAEGTDGQTNLSSQMAGDEADGRGLRRRMAFGLAICLGIVAIVVGLSVARGGDGKSSNNSNDAGEAMSIDSYGKTSEATIDSVQAKVEVYRHKKSHMEVMTMVPDDPSQDGVLGISFRTIPQNNHGTAHVVEHAILAGSEKYPIKDPWNQLMRGSLQTYFDTWTAKDRTVFAMASRNREDFKNSMEVMLDGIFHPLMVQDDYAWIFRREGWRLEVKEDRKGYYLSGNVFNEAKTSQMRPNFSMESYTYKKLFKDVPYGIDALGEVRDIVSMTQREVVDYYHRFYKPANGQAFCYGPKSYVNDCLDMLNGVLKDFDHDKSIRTNTELPWQELTVILSSMNKVPYPSYQDADDYRLAITTVLNDEHMDSRVEVMWFLLEELLIGFPEGTIAHVLSHMGVGDDVFGGLEYSLQQWTFTVGVSGIKIEADVDRVRDAVREKLNEVVANGFSDDLLKGAMNKVAFRLHDVSSSGEPRGIKHFRSILNKWNYDQDPKLPLLYSKAFDSLREEIESSDGNGQAPLLDLVQRYLIDNSHKATVQMFPSTTLSNIYHTEEHGWLNNIDTIATPEQVKQFVDESKELHEIQDKEETEEELSTIPRIAISDLNATMWQLPTKVDTDIFDSGLTMLEHTLEDSNGIAYVDFAIDISNINFEDIVLLPMFAQMLLRGGTDRKSETQFNREIDQATGGVEVFPLIDEILQTDSEGGYIVPDGKHYVSKIVIRTSCVASTAGLGMFTTIRSMLFDAKVDNEEAVKRVLRKLIDDMEDDIQVNGHLYTTLRINSRYSLPGFLAEQWKGVTQLFNLRRSLAMANENFHEFGQRLLVMQDAMKRGNRNGMVLSVTGDHQAIKDISGSIEVFVKDLLPPAAQVSRFPDFGQVEHPWVTEAMHVMEEEKEATAADEAFLVPTRLNHVGRGGVLYDQGERIKGSDAVALHLLSGYYLYDRVRFTLGASQAWAVLDFDSGSVVYQSENDPKIKATLDVYEDGAAWLFNLVSGRDTLPAEARGAVVGTIGALDGPAFQPSEVGYHSVLQYLRQDKPEYRQKWRDEILRTTPEDIADMVRRLGAWSQESIVVVTDQNHLDDASNHGLDFTVCDYKGQGCHSS